MKFTLIYKDKRILKELISNMTIKDLLKEMELSPQTIVAKQNNDIVFEDTIIKENDEIQLIQIIYGG